MQFFNLWSTSTIGGMLSTVVLGLLTCAARAAVRGGGFITLKDNEFIGEDAALAAELSRRRASASAPLPDLAAANFTADHFFQDEELNENSTLMLRQNETRKKAFTNEPTPEDIGMMSINLMEHACYSTQYRLKDIDRLFKRYENDARFRIAYAFKQLDAWQYQITMLWQFQKQWRDYPTHHFRVYRHMLYLTNAIKKMIDVTYTKDYILELTQILLDSQATGDGSAFADNLRRNNK